MPMWLVSANCLSGNAMHEGHRGRKAMADQTVQLMEDIQRYHIVVVLMIARYG